MARVRFSYLPDKLLRKLKLHTGGGLAKHEAWADAILPADAEAQPVEEMANQRPLAAVGILLGIVMVMLVVRLVMLQLISGDHNAALADGNRLRTKVTRAQRGVMYDRNGVLIARNHANDRL